MKLAQSIKSLEIRVEKNPYKELWATVLEFGLISAAKGDKKDEAWILSTNRKVGSFIWICDILDIKCTNKLRQLVFDRDNLLHNIERLKDGKLQKFYQRKVRRKVYIK